jgi:SAM-dependent methyltransferase
MTADPFSLPWFLQVERKRYARHGYWIPKLLEFHKHRNERLLAIGDGLGTEWARYAEHGTEVLVCHPSARHLSIVRRHLELRGLSGQFLQGNPAAIPVRDESLDLACLFDPSLGSGSVEAVVAELYRVLKPGGKVIAVVPAWYNARHWQDRLMPWQRWLWKSPPPQHDQRFSARQLARLFERFVVHRVYKRHLRRSDLPHIWRWMALPLLERIMGRYLVLKAYKPISAALPSVAAA